MFLIAKASRCCSLCFRFVRQLLTSSRFQVRLLKARGSRPSGARGWCSTGFPLISGGLLDEITGGIFLNLRLSSNTRSTSWARTERNAEETKGANVIKPSAQLLYFNELHKDVRMCETWAYPLYQGKLCLS